MSLHPKKEVPRVGDFSILLRRLEKLPKKTCPVIDTSELRGAVGLPEDVATARTFTLPLF